MDLKRLGTPNPYPESKNPESPVVHPTADIIYQFNAVDMIRENYNEIEKIKAASQRLE